MFFPLFLHVFEKGPENHDPISVWHTVVPPGEISFPDIQFHAESQGCHQQIKMTTVHDHAAAPIFSFQARSTEAGMYLWSDLLPYDRPTREMHLQGTEVMEVCSVHAPFCHDFPSRCAVLLQTNSFIKELGEVCLRQTYSYKHISPRGLNACVLFMAPSILINIRNSLIMFFSQLVFINLIYTYLHITP